MILAFYFSETSAKDRQIPVVVGGKLRGYIRVEEVEGGIGDYDDATKPRKDETLLNTISDEEVED